MLCLLTVLIGVVQAEEPAALAEARARVREKKLEEAVAAYTRLLETTPGNLEGRKERARVLGWLGRYTEALSDYDEVLAVTPGDVEPRIGRGRVLGWMKRYAEAETEVRRALAADPRAAEAHAVLGNLLSWQQRYAEATRAYEEARALAPQDVEPVLGLARLRLWQEDPVGAKAGYEEALRLDPENAEAREGLARIATIPSPRRFRLDLGYRYEALSGGNSDWHQGTAMLVVRPRKGTVLFTSVDQYRRFDRDDTHVTLGGAQTLPRDVTLSGSFTYGPGAEIVARQIYEVEVSHRPTAWAVPTLRYRRSNFPGDIHVDLLSPGLELAWAPYASLVARYYFARASNAGDGHAGSGRLMLYPEGVVSPHVGVAYGRETFLAATVEQVERGVDVFTVSAGATWRVTDAMGVRLDYAYEDRRGSYVKHGVGTSLFFEF